jgi:DNA-binding GntR family transcriptional regulator
MSELSQITERSELGAYSSPDAQRTRERHFNEEMRLLLHEMGGTAMTGRIIEYLLIREQAHQSSSELSDYLDVSLGAVSQATRQLSRAGMIKRLKVTVGRQPVAFGSGMFFTPLDLISSFTPTTIDAEYKPGVDVVRVDVFRGFATNGTVLVA